MEKSIKVLNSLITVNNDRIEGYETASEATEERDLKTMFAQFISTSQKCRQELAKEINTLGGEVAEGTETKGKFFRAWMDLKVSFTNKDRKAILESCEYGEDKAKEAYNKALEDGLDHLSIAQQNMILAQRSSLKVNHDHVKSLRNALVNA